MRRMEMMTAGGVTLAGVGALVGLAIGSGDSGSKLAVPRAQSVEVRTEIIRKTVNVYRREHPHHAAGTGPTRGSSLRTSAPGASAVASPPPVVSTRSSGSRGTSGSSPVGNSGSTPVKTRTSGARSSGGGSSSSRPVSTRSSGGGDDHGGGHDD